MKDEDPVVDRQNVLKAAMNEVGFTGRYQLLVVILMGFVWMQITYSGMINSFVFMNPMFNCSGKSTSELEACNTLRQCEVVNDYTAIFHMGLICDFKHVRSTIQSVYTIGCIFGILGISTLSDLKGRRLSFLLAIACGIVGVFFILLGGFNHHYHLVMFGQIWAGASGAALPILTYTITGELYPHQMRQKSIMGYCVVWGLTQMGFLLIGELAWWKYLLWFKFIPLIIIFIVGIFYLRETPSYYFLNECSVQKTIHEIQILGRRNGKTGKQIQKAKELLMQGQKKLHNSKQLKMSMNQSIMRIFGNKHYLKVIVCMTAAQIGFNTFYYGVLSSLEKIGYTFSINVFLVGFHEFIGYFSAGYLIGKLQRKKGLIVCNIVTALIGMSYATDIVSENQTIQSVALSMTILGMTYCFTFISMINTESFHPQIQATAMGLSSGLSQIGRFFTPFIITYMNDQGTHPFFAVSIILLLIGVAPVFFIDETLHTKSKKI